MYNLAADGWRRRGDRYVHETFFVSPATYLPIRILIPSGYQHIRWLPPTTANLAKLHVSIPPGFRQIKPPPRG